MHNLFKNLKKKQEKGQGLVEYALILVLVAIVVIAALMILGPIIGNVFSTINSSLGGLGMGGGAPAGPALPSFDDPMSMGFVTSITTSSACSAVGGTWGDGWAGVGCYQP